MMRALIAGVAFASCAGLVSFPDSGLDGGFEVDGGAGSDAGAPVDGGAPVDTGAADASVLTDADARAAPGGGGHDERAPGLELREGTPIQARAATLGIAVVDQAWVRARPGADFTFLPFARTTSGSSCEQATSMCTCPTAPASICRCARRTVR